MSNLYLFVPKAEKTAQQNLTEFIRVAKEELSIFGNELDFESNVWDLTDYINLKGHGNKKVRCCFVSSSSDRDAPDAPMSKPFILFAKAYIRYMHGLNPIINICQRLMILRSIEEALIHFSEPSITKLNQQIMNHSSQLIVKSYSSSLAYRLGGQLEILLDFLVSHHLLATPFKWKNPIKRPLDTQRIGKEADDRRAKKLPSEAALQAIPKLFRMASLPREKIVMSIVAIMCSAPERISEVLHLPLDCEVRRKDEDGNEVYGLRWWPAKGALPQIKWIAPSMVEVVQEAIQRARETTRAAREVALWYEAHPSSIYLSKELEYLRQKKFITTNEALGVLNHLGKDSARLSAQLKISRHKRIDNKYGYSFNFKEFEKAVINLLPHGFPFLDKAKKLKFSEALFLARRWELNDGLNTCPCLIEPIGTNFINSALGTRSKFGFYSIFEAHGFKEKNGDPIRVSTHQFRHYLNTLAQAGGMSELDIAKWSGRKDVRQNAAYDHVSSKEMLEIIREAVGNQEKAVGPLAYLKNKALIPRDEFERLIIPTAHLTDIGFCIHDYAMSPCNLHLDCINCQELVCVKGHKKTEQNIRKALKESSALMRSAEEAFKNGYHGADRWFNHHKSVHERLFQLNEILDDSKIGNGTVIQLAKTSHVETAKNLIEDKRGYRARKSKKTIKKLR